MILSNADYDFLMREYEETRDRHRREREARVAAAEARIPGLAALSDELRSLSMTAARQKLADPSADTGWLSGRTALITARKRQLLLANGLPADELSLVLTVPPVRIPVTLTDGPAAASGRRLPCASAVD